MKIKRFVAKDIRTALDEIKVALGPDAIIMSNKNVDGGVEIVAAIDEDNNAVINKPAATSQPAPMDSVAQRVEQAPNILRNASTPAERSLSDDQVSLSGFQKRLIKQQAQFHVDEHTQEQPIAPVFNQQATPPPEVPAWAAAIADNVPSQSEASERRVTPNNHSQDPLNVMFGNQAQIDTQSLDKLHQEMAAMRQLLQHQVSGLMEQEANRRDPVKSILLKGLENVGFSQEISQQLALDVTANMTVEQAVHAVQNTMSRRVLTTNDDILAHGGVVALLGPTGVGKTTTVAKLAARCAMQYGSDKIAMITTDCYRIGAYEQLNTYGKILGCPVKVAKDAQQLADALYQCRDKRLVLIDTAGMGQRDIRLSEQLSTLVNSSHVNIRSYLVLPATAQRKVLEDAVVQFRKMPLVGCIITKMDEAVGAGDVLSVAITHSLPLAYLTNGQRVPEDIGAADSKSLINSVIEQLGQAENCSLSSSGSAQFTSFNG